MLQSVASIDEYVANILASAPPLTPDTIDRVVAALKSVSDD